MRTVIGSLVVAALCVGCTDDAPSDQCVLEKPPAEWLYSDQPESNRSKD